MAVDMFLKYGDVKGESADDKHKDEIDVLAWSWGARQSGTSHTGAGGGAGKVEVSNLTVKKYIDRSSPNLFKNCCSGEHVNEATLVVRKAGGKPLEYLKIKMQDVIITSVQTGGSASDDRLVEEVAFNFGKVTLEYVPQKADGSGGGVIPAGFDIAANKPI